MEVNSENVIAAYKVADENGKAMLKALFPSADFEAEKQPVDNRPVTERIKTFEDALIALGDEHPLVSLYNVFVNEIESMGNADQEKDVLAYLKLRIITAALNEGWVPPFDKEAYMYWPWFDYYTKEEVEAMDDEEKESLGLVGASACDGSQSGLGSVASCPAWSATSALAASRLAYKSRELALYSGEQFKEIWADYCFVGAFE